MSSPITIHVLDTVVGRPAVGVRVSLEIQNSGDWAKLGQGTTGADGRLNGLLPSGQLMAGTYRISFDTAGYFRSQKRDVFYPQVQVVFVVADATQHYHIPLLLSTYGYSTYRGS